VTIAAASEADRALAQAAGLGAVVAPPTDVRALERAGLARSHTVVAAAPDAQTNLEVLELARTHRPDARVVAWADDPAALAAIEELGAEAFSLEHAASLGLALLVARPALSAMLEAGAGPDGIVEARVRNPAFAGKPLRELELPPACLLVMVKRGGTTSIPDGRTRLQVGDAVTLAGDRQALDLLRDRLEAGA
jgi:trk system potassium uptake protein TrkA